jgi:predicted transposase YbfD/YdcC
VERTRAHSQLDVSFNEDDSRKRDGFATQIFSIIIRVALNLIKHEAQSAVSIENDWGQDGITTISLLKI